MKEKILVSACLLGENCRYDGKEKKVKEILELARYYDIIPICPEVSGGLKTPREPSEIKDGMVINKKGLDVTDNYNAGAYWAESVCRIMNIKMAILKEGSPSCGTHKIHDGSFSGKMIDGQGITAKRLSRMGVKVISEEEAIALLNEKKAPKQN